MHQRMFAAGLALVVGCATPITINAIGQDQAAQAQRQADNQQTDQWQLARELPLNPPDVAAAFVEDVAIGGANATLDACTLFTSAAAAQFVAGNRAPDCLIAMQHLHDQVTDTGAYTNDLSVPDTAWTQMGSIATLDGCALNWSGPWSDAPSPPPGPLPGLWTLTQLDGRGWQISSYRPC